MTGLPSWGPPYPDPEQLRAECDVMRACIVDSLREALGDDEFVGIYSHGSSLKRWDTPLDYVAELSDVDVQMVLHHPERLTDDLELALHVARDYDRRFRERLPDAHHVPRPQIMAINEFMADPDFLPSPPGGSRTEFGRPIDEVRPQPDHARVPPADLRALQRRDGPELAKRAAMWLIDRPGKYAWQGLRDLAWRVGPTGPRVLSVLGTPYLDAWGSNRTKVYHQLVERGELKLAEDYATFYLRGWDFFLSGNENVRACHEGIVAGIRVLQRGHEIGSAQGETKSAARH